MDTITDYLVREEVYQASLVDCYAFRRGSDVVDGRALALGNMVGGFPFEIEGVIFRNSESAYIAGMFSDSTVAHTAIQVELLAEANGFMAKKRVKRINEAIKREDWEEFNMMWMLYVVWCKAVGNIDFQRLLLSLPSDVVIIEDSTFQKSPTASFWGTKNREQSLLHRALDKRLKGEGISKCSRSKILDSKRLLEWRRIGCFEGCNVMGKILMLCRDALKERTVPAIDLDLLRSKNIFLLGNRLTFDCIPGQYIAARA